MFNSLDFVFFFFIDIMLCCSYMVTWCVFTFQARVGMEVPFDLLGTVYHQVIIIIFNHLTFRNEVHKW